jgi:hypothetical protein
MSEVRDRYVYCIDDEDGQPVYVGVGKGDRMYDHMRDVRFGKNRCGNQPKFEYLLACVSRGYAPEAYKIAEGLTKHEAMEYEKVLIAWYGRRDAETGCLFNATAGGGGVKGHGRSALTVMSKKSRRYWDENPHLRAHMAELQRKRKPSEDELARRSLSMRARLSAPEARAVMAARTAEQWKDPEIRAKRSAPQSPETREKISKSMLALRARQRATREVEAQA